jgi:hypothetical protein
VGIDGALAMMKRLSIALIVGMLLVLLALGVAAPATAQTSPTLTYTPIPTRTQLAATQAVSVITVGGGNAPAMINRSVSYGDVYIVLAVAAVFILLGIRWAYQWAMEHLGGRDVSIQSRS